MYSEITKDFFMEFPLIKEKFDNEKSLKLIDNIDGDYVIWGIGIFPIINKMLNETNGHEELLKNIFQFFEKMSTSEEDIKELLMYSILEKFGDETDILEKAKSLMGDKTSHLSEEIEKFHGR